jgi:hypothetical protein
LLTFCLSGAYDSGDRTGGACAQTTPHPENVNFAGISSGFSLPLYTNKRGSATNFSDVSFDLSYKANTQKSVKMSRPIEQALSNLIPRHSGVLPAELIDLASSLLTQSRSKLSNLRAEEEIGRTYACANIACERYAELPLTIYTIAYSSTA